VAKNDAPGDVWKFNSSIYVANMSLLESPGLSVLWVCPKSGSELTFETPEAAFNFEQVV